MKYLCLAYGDAADWARLSQLEQDSLLAQDALLRDKGALVAAVRPAVHTVSAWNGTVDVNPSPVAALPRTLAGFSVIDARDLAEAVALVKDSPCARANGFVEIREIQAINDAPTVVCADRS